MPRNSAHAPQLPLVVRDTVGYPEALARYEATRPVLKGERSLSQSQQAWINYWRLWRALPRFRGGGLLGLIDHRGIQRVLAQHHLSPDALQRHRQWARQAPSPPWPPATEPK